MPLPAALPKPHAVEQLAADVGSYQSDIVIITETHCKAKHTDSVLNMPGYTLYRHDSQRRRGGRVALYVRSALQSAVWTCSADDRVYELHWQRVGDLFLGALYHPPRSLYTADLLLNYIEASVDEINSQFPSATIVLAGDFNQLSDHDKRTGLAQATCGANILDRMFVSRPVYPVVRVVTSVMRSDHRAIVAFAERLCTRQPQLEHFEKRRQPSTTNFCSTCLTLGLTTVKTGTFQRQMQTRKSIVMPSTAQLLSSWTASILNVL